MDWQEIGRTWLVQLAENIPDAEAESWPEVAPASPPSGPGRFGFKVVLASLAVGVLLVIGLGARPGEPVEPQRGHCQPLLPPLHRHGVTERPAARPVATHWKCV